LRYLQLALDLDPRNYVTLQQISASYIYLRRFAEAALMLDRAHAIQPDDPDAKSGRALVLFPKIVLVVTRYNSTEPASPSFPSFHFGRSYEGSR
jgi:hypothetical protein